VASVDTPDDQLTLLSSGRVPTNPWIWNDDIPNSELAARLGSKHAWDPRGRQYWYEGFESAVLQWNTAFIGASTLTRSNVTSWIGQYSACNLIPAVAGNGMTMTKSFVRPRNYRIGLQIFFSCDSANWVSIEFQNNHYTGARRYRSDLVIDRASGELDITTGGAPVAVGRVFNNRADAHFWHQIKLVCDFSTNYYQRLLFDGVEYDLTQYRMDSIGSGIAERFDINIITRNGAGGISNIYFDEIVYSDMEP